MLSLSDEHKVYLSALFDQPPQLLQDFCRLAIDYLKKGANLKLYSAAAQKLQVEVNVIQLAVEGLVHLIVKSRQHNLSKADFRDLILATGFNGEQESVLSELHDSNKVDIDSALTSLVPSLMHYHDLEWRFDVQVASRSFIRQTIPNVTMKLTLQELPQVDEEVKHKCLLLEIDPNNLKHLIQKLDEALLEMSGQHSRRLQRIFK